VATTNYPERLGERLINRPSRFDRIFKIGMPGEQARRMYIVSLLERGKKVGILDQKSIQVDRWIEDTEGLSFAHLRELYIGVVLLGDPYEEVIEMLKEMGQPLESNGKRAGFFEIGDPKNG
jgi:SpoVK/Ycf46/Vps4 family AAA+-type ATPase